MPDEEASTSGGAIDPSNVGFQLLKKCGWKEGTGLGVLEQGRLEPVEAHVKNNKLGVGAEKSKKIKLVAADKACDAKERDEDSNPPKKSKGLTKRMRKLLEEEKRAEETAFAQEFFREFWPDNV